MSQSKPNYRIVYFFAVQHPTHAEIFTQFLLTALRTTDPSAPEGNQPSLVEGVPHTVGFIEQVGPEQLKDLHPHMKALVLQTFGAFANFCRRYGDEGAGIALTAYVQEDTTERTIALFAQTQDGALDKLVFAYQHDVTAGEKLTPETVTHVNSGTDAVDAMLAYFGVLQSSADQSSH